ncbi:MAG: SUF system NifU family Fe-S cluster assembly protein [Clostridia bacterium]|nr:SUF system NifU family Fe-S cluster assembly protein [Clostridia bacterium]
MDGLDEIYTDLIMEHSMNSPNKKHLEGSTCDSLGHNPNCGDEIKIEAVIEDGKIKDMAFSGHGCAISQSSTSIMIDVLRGKTVDEAKKIIESFMRMIKREKLSDDEKTALQDAIAFENVSNMPARVKCALLSWHTLEDLLKQLK